MNEKDLDKIDSDFDRLIDEFTIQTYDEIEKLQKQVDKNDMASTTLFIELLGCYELLDEKIELFEIPEKYLKLAYECALNDINSQHDIGNAYICLAMFSNLKKFKDKALFYYNKAIEAEPTNADFYIKRGSFYLLIKKNKEAKADYKKALSLKPDDVSLQILCKNDFSTDSKIKDILTVISIIVLIVLSILAEIY